MWPCAAATYCSGENSKATSTGIPSKMTSSMARTPSGVPGIRTKRLAKAALECSCAAARIVCAALSAKSGEIPSETQPCVPPLASKEGRSNSAACVRSSSANSKNSSSSDSPAADRTRMLSS